MIATRASLTQLIEQMKRQTGWRLPELRRTASAVHFLLGSGEALPLEAGAIHEWFGGVAGQDIGGAGESRRNWAPPMAALVELAARAVESRPGLATVWIGRRCWPYAPALLQRSRGYTHNMLRDSLFVDPPDDASRLWAMDLGLRCQSVAAVVADGSRLTMAATRRLQLAAASTGAMGLIARPPWELCELSAARTRWRVTPRRTDTTEPCWEIELLRRKGIRPAIEAAQRVVVRWEHETSAVRVVPDVHDRSVAQTVSQVSPDVRIA